MAEKARGVKFFMRVGLLSGQVFSPFCEHWLTGSHGGGGISRRPGVGSADHAGRHLWLQAGVGSANRAVVIHGFDDACSTFQTSMIRRFHPEPTTYAAAPVTPRHPMCTKRGEDLCG